MLTESEKASIVAVISRGDMAQFYRLFEDYEARLVVLEGTKHAHSSTGKASFGDVAAVEPPASDAKSVDVRDSVVELAEQFNKLLASLKGE